MDAYNSIHEIHKGHAAGDSDIEKQASQLASDVRYKAKGRFKEGASEEAKRKVYLALLSASPAPSVVKAKAKKKLIGESVTEDAAYDSVLKQLKGKYGSNAVIGTGETIKDTRSEKSKVKSQRKRAASDEKERRFKKRNPAVTSGRYPKDDEKAWAAAREREKREGIGEATAVGKVINAIREDSKYGYDSKGRSKNPEDIKKRKKVSEGKLIHGPFGPYITGQKMPKEHKETPLKQVPYESLNGNRKSVGEASVEEEVGVSSSAAMKAAQDEAKLRKKEQDAVKKEKKALKREETAPAVAKIIEKIQIGKASPKSPNCIIMPKKDEISDNGKKSTKEVVTKKQKQFFNKEGTVKTYRQFMTETEEIDELWGMLAKGATAVAKSGVGQKVAAGAAKVAKSGVGQKVAAGASKVAQSGVGQAVKSGGEAAASVTKLAGKTAVGGAKLAGKTAVGGAKAYGNYIKGTPKRYGDFFKGVKKVADATPSAVTKTGSAVKSGASAAKKVVGAAADVAKTGAKKVASGTTRLAKDLTTHAPKAAEKGASTFKTSIDKGEGIVSAAQKGIKDTRVQYQTGKIKAAKPGISGKELTKQAEKAVKASDKKWTGRAQQAKKLLGKNPLETLSTVDTARGLLGMRGGQGGGKQKQTTKNIHMVKDRGQKVGISQNTG